MPPPKTYLQNDLQRHFEIGHHPLQLLSKDTTDTDFQHLTFSNRGGERIRAFYIPPRGAGPAPAILYIHAHGDRYDIGADELLDGRPALEGPLGPVLAELGYAVLCIDLPGFGSRAEFPESALAKKALWKGGSLAGQMVGELHSAFEWLAGQDGVDSALIGLFGISMGATLAYWLAAAEPRIAALGHLCCMADFDVLIQTGAHDLHGIYLTVPGLLNTASNGQIAGSIAPRPQFIGIGDRDPLTPPHAVNPALEEVRAGYVDTLPNLQVLRSTTTGHVETPEMRRSLIAFYKSSL